MDMVIPMMYRVIEGLNDKSMVGVMNDELQEEMKAPESLLLETRAARKTVHGHDDLHDKYITKIRAEDKRLYFIASVCSPHYKAFDFDGSNNRLKRFAHDVAREEYIAN